MSEGEKLPNDISEFLGSTRKTEAQIRRGLYQELAQQVLEGLGYPQVIDEIQEAITANGIYGAVKEAGERAGGNTTDFEQKAVAGIASRITCVPNHEAAMNLLRTAYSGRLPGEKDAGEVKQPKTNAETVAQFPLAAPSISLRMDTINPNGQSKSTAAPNIKGTQDLLRRLLHKAGFLKAEEDFALLRPRLRREGRFTLPHLIYNQFRIIVEKPQTPKVSPEPLSWAVNIQVTFNP